MSTPNVGDVVWAYITFTGGRRRMVPALVLGSWRHSLSLLAVNTDASLVFRTSVPHVSSPAPVCFDTEWWLDFNDVANLHPDAVAQLQKDGQWPDGLEYVP